MGMRTDGEWERKLSTLEMSEIFGVSPATIWRWATKENGIPHTKTQGKQLRFEPSLVVPHLVKTGQDVPRELARLAKCRPAPAPVEREMADAGQ